MRIQGVRPEDAWNWSCGAPGLAQGPGVPAKLTHLINFPADATGGRVTTSVPPSTAAPARAWAGPAFDAVLSAIGARAAEHDAEASFAHEAYDLLQDLGVLSLTVPTSQGGAGAGLAEACQVVESLGAADPAVGLLVSQHYLHHAMLASPANRWPAVMRQRVQRSSVESGALVNAARVEPDLGTPARGGLPATVAERLAKGQGFRVTGRKTYTTGIPRLAWMALWARTDDPEPRVGTFLVPTALTGWRVEETWDHLGMRATRSDDVVFEGLVLPADHAVDVRPPAEHAVGMDPTLMAWNNLLIAALYNGVARSARDWLVRYLNERVPTNLGAPLASLPRFQEAVGRIEALLLTSGRLISTTAAGVDQDPTGDGPESSALVKHTATTNAIDAVMLGVSLVGNPGLSRANPLERHLRDVLCSRIHTPQDDTILIGAGRGALSSGGRA
ncbi:MAG: acyl-CoA dehydrogenase [Acidimicrobiia bacterium]|nr:acyl-CoA dehydrogenase [Acidimicrobiia bacterium]